MTMTPPDPTTQTPIASLRDGLSKQCNIHLYGECHSAHCLRRGGYDKNKPQDHTMATCTEHEAIEAIATLERSLLAAEAENGRLREERDKLLVMQVAHEEGVEINRQLRADLAAAKELARQEKEHHDFYRSKVSDYMGAEIEWQKRVIELLAKLDPYDAKKHDESTP